MTTLTETQPKPNTVLFHLAFPVGNIADTKAFYVDRLGCLPGRESPSALILNLYGHQLVAHVSREPLQAQGSIYPRHFGLVFTAPEDWQALVDRLGDRGVPFYQAPRQRFPSEILEHSTFFIEDPFFNLLEFKTYRHPEAIFGQLAGPVANQIGDAPC